MNPGTPNPPSVGPMPRSKTEPEPDPPMTNPTISVSSPCPARLRTERFTMAASPPRWRISDGADGQDRPPRHGETAEKNPGGLQAKTSARRGEKS